jgi:hypothetical protein
MPRLYRLLEKEKEAAAEAEKARRLQERRDAIAAAKKARWEAWRSEREKELDALITSFEDATIGVVEYNKREAELEAKLGKTAENFEDDDVGSPEASALPNEDGEPERDEDDGIKDVIMVSTSPKVANVARSGAAKKKNALKYTYDPDKQVRIAVSFL